MKVKINNVTFTTMNELPSIDVEDLHLFSEVYSWPEELPEELGFAAEADGNLLGWVKLSRIRWISRSAYLTFVLDQSWRGKGYGIRMLQAFLEFYFRVLGFHRITAEVYEYNTRSRQLVEKLGFLEEGRLRKARFWNGKFHDIIVYGLLAEEYPGKGEW